MSQIKQRDSARNAIKRYVEKSKNVEKLSKQEILSYLELLKEKWARFNAAQDKVDETCGPETYEQEESEREQTESWYVTATANWKSILDTISDGDESPTTTKGSPLNNAEHGDTAKIMTNIKLPKFDLPRFSGDPTTWMAFFDSFNTIVIKNEMLTGSQKLHYLRNCLSDEPLRLIANFKLQDCNFTFAWDLLKTRYNVVRVIKDHHFSAIFSTPKVSADTATDIKNVLDPILRNIRALESLRMPVNYWDDWLIHVVVHRLAYETRRHWELQLNNDIIPNFNDLQEFLENRCRSLELLEKSTSMKQTNAFGRKVNKPVCLATQANESFSNRCFYCSGKHSIYQCSNFRSITVAARLEAVRDKGACKNCLSVHHTDLKCQSSSTCKICHRRHHSLLHLNYNTTCTTAPLANSSRATSDSQTSLTANTTFSTHAERSVLLATALVKTNDSVGQPHTLRALLDNGSQVSLITEQCVQKLKLVRRASTVSVSGIGLSKGTVKGETTIRIWPMNGQNTYLVHPIILSKITGSIPSVQIDSANWPHINGLDLADPSFNFPAQVDMILGADVLPLLLEPNLIKGVRGTPIAQRTVFGWVLFGATANKQQQKQVTCFFTNIELAKAIAKTWQLDEIREKRLYSPEEEACEKLFQVSHSRDADGRFIVQLPFKPNLTLGESRAVAVQSWLRMEKRLFGDEKLRASYNAFLQDMLDQGHMEPAPPGDYSTFYMPHHSVLKDTSSTTKVRVVFNASQKTSNGLSLNDVLMLGPRLQQDLTSILYRFQTHRFAMIADVAAMYRQVKVDKTHTDYQRIIWRKTPAEPIKDYRMLRVTFGVTSSAHHATKALQLTTVNYQSKYSVASLIVCRDFYMDDLLTGHHSESQLQVLRKQITEILRSGCFELRKWASNSSRVLQSIPLETQQHEISHILAEDEDVRALGLMWNSKEDYLYFTVKLGPPPKHLTKRNLLSDSCRLFDPIGKIAPVTIVPKILFQKLWTQKLNWDDLVPHDVATFWLDFREDLKVLSTLRIPRWLGTGDPTSKTELHCFADASERAYAGVIYARTVQADGTITVSMICAKTKVAPLQTISVAKLELCAAVLAATLAKQVQDSLGPLISNIFGWTDSMNALAWLRSHPSKWSVFVSNRVAKAQAVIDAENWFHVISEQNPADSASRGMHPTKLIEHSLWWKGPFWLALDSSCWSHPLVQNPSTDLEARRTKTITLTTNLTIDWGLYSMFSSLAKLKRVTAYCMRFIFNLKMKRCGRASDIKLGPLKINELNTAEIFWIKLVQKTDFANEIASCLVNKPISLQSPVIRLNPFLGKKGLLRVGGRIVHANILPDTKFPILLSSKSKLAHLLVRDIHKILLHGGPQAMQTMLQQRFWVIGARNLTRKIYNECIICRRNSSTKQQQLMANLPSVRVNSGRPFQSTGVDMAGPYLLKFSKGRGSKAVKGYIAVFICMATGAMHLELAGDLTSQTFIFTLKRFLARRGHCKTLFSDNGTNFTGAERDLQTLYNEVLKDTKLKQYLSDSLIEWRFNPPSAPHMGGFWESAVKRTKFHLKRALNSTLLTYEEFYTVLTEVEACVNSRPLCPLSTDASQLEALTPGHFLITEPLKTLPEPDALPFRGNINHRWILLSQIRQHFWKRWQEEYLVSLQRRAKWLRPQKNVEVGDLVAIRDQNAPPCKWKLARVIKCLPGDDGKVRVVELKTSEGILIRPIVKLVMILPNN